MRRALSRELVSLMLTLCLVFFGAVEADDSAEVKALREQVENLQRTVEQLQNAVQSMQGAPARTSSPTPSQSAIDQFMSREGIGAEQRPIEQVETPARTGGGAAQRYRHLLCRVILWWGIIEERWSLANVTSRGPRSAQTRLYLG